MDPLHVDIILLIIVAIISGFIGVLTLKLSQRFERSLILRKKKFEKEYEIAEDIIKDTSELLLVVNNLGNSIKMHFDFKSIISDGVLTEEEIADFIGFYKVYINPKVRMEDLKRDLTEKPDETLHHFRENIVKYYVAYVELMHKILTYANEHTIEFYFRNPKINEDLEFLEKLMLEVNKIYVEYTYQNMDYVEVTEHMKEWCESINDILNELIKLMKREIDIDFESKGKNDNL